MYGETEDEYGEKEVWEGLSPRVRGNRVQAAATIWVYPRVYGETSLVSSNAFLPAVYRVRGNRRRTARKGLGGSIPACTGKPKSRVQAAATIWVYPRVYGETSLVSSNAFSASGLSPRVRGNRVRAVLPVHEAGSIPACTGKPPVSVDGGRGC